MEWKEALAVYPQASGLSLKLQARHIVEAQYSPALSVRSVGG
jgi:hypothetical protein